MERINPTIRQLCPFDRARTTLVPAITIIVLLGLAGQLTSPSWAIIAECGVTGTTSIRVQNQTGVGMLRAAANCTGGGTLEADWAGAITLDSPITIASGMFLSITGEDTLAEVQGGSQTRMFEVSRGAGLTLTQLRLSGGTAENGGAIHSDSAALTLDSCMFHGNAATDGDGGAVWADGGNVTIVGGEFTSNNASGHGGAVAASRAIDRLVVQGGSKFEGNMALIGGALYCSGVAESSSETSCSLRDTEFSANTSTGESEEMVLSDDPSEGVDGGGAVAFLFAAADVTDSVFRGNYAQFSGGAMLGRDGTDIAITGCMFESNTAMEHGGAIAAASMTLGGNTQLSNNFADGDGGACVRGPPGNGTARVILGSGAANPKDRSGLLCSGTDVRGVRLDLLASGTSEGGDNRGDSGSAAWWGLNTKIRDYLFDLE